MKLSREEVVHIAALCRLGLSEEELERFQEQVSNILENFEILKQVDTSDVPPTAYPIPLENVVRKDEAEPSTPQSDILANAPRQEEGYFRVKAVLEQ
ncbi:MAG: Asp-tRNA(Asn)/Glu-tRNA(Gln) amidotransferase subunit GatC [Dehalococcoidia bacterium]|nr:Asp-tRNA(Asn)/Glu-tRNA(Gln) amidotransferase subunit GatC [Dehalococcoidia bacterium]